MDIKRFLWLMTGGSSSPDTTPDGKQAFLVIGDSKAQGLQADASFVAPPDATGTGYEWYSGAVTALTSFGLQTAYNADGATCWSQFCITYNSLTGKKPVIINQGLAASLFYATTPGGGNRCWYTNDTLYSDAVTAANDCMTAMGVTKLKGILVILGINDKTHTETFANINTAITSLMDRLTTDFPGVGIYIDMPGISSQVPTIKYAQINNAIEDLVTTYADVHIDVNENSMLSWDLADALSPHFFQAGQDQIGKMKAQYVANVRGTSNKRVRRILNQFYDPISESAANTIETQIVANESLFTTYLDNLQIYVSSVSKKNVLVDWVGRTSPLSETVIVNSAGFTWVNGGGVTFDGTQWLRTFFHTLMWKYASQDDYCFGIKTGTNNTPAGTLANLYGNSNSGGQTLGQDASNRTLFRNNETSNQTYTTDTKLQDDTRYVVRRTSSTNMELLKSAAIVSTKSVASSTPSTVFHNVGVLNTANIDTEALSGFINCGVKYSFNAKANGLDVAALETMIEALIGAL